ncbi:unnamed protein product [Allacma fusca]|uniref:Uncharacterized protein n=1 Tax=Allacma fusca TaxID=39272 RepID=A0A8J2PC32_9HEXA|nr:unnamed protein product [Allacma fusca]
MSPTPTARKALSGLTGYRRGYQSLYNPRNLVSGQKDIEHCPRETLHTQEKHPDKSSKPEGSLELRLSGQLSRADQSVE